MECHKVGTIDLIKACYDQAHLAEILSPLSSSFFLSLTIHCSFATRSAKTGCDYSSPTERTEFYEYREVWVGIENALTPRYIEGYKHIVAFEC